MSKVLVTGATGFIGTHVVGELLRLGHEVVATSADPLRARSWTWYAQTTYKPLDLGENRAEDLMAYFGQPDALLHLAWEGLPDYKGLFHFEDNLPRHYRFLKNLVVHGLKDITVAGTCQEYGMREGALQENMEAMPGTPYALAKDTLRKFLTELSRVHPFLLKWPRIFYVYGPGQNPRSLFSQLERALEAGDKDFPMSGGEQVRDYLPVADMAASLCRIALQPEITGIINCCSGRPVILKDFVQAYAAGRIHLKLGVYPYPDYEPMAFWGDTAKLNTIL
jgi:dTDP-6-deoxy-L-talose 4-dehydrogenase (NAD+)